jgi:hypothetical protein
MKQTHFQSSSTVRAVPRALVEFAHMFAQGRDCGGALSAGLLEIGWAALAYHFSGPEPRCRPGEFCWSIEQISPGIAVPASGMRNVSLPLDDALAVWHFCHGLEKYGIVRATVGYAGPRDRNVLEAVTFFGADGQRAVPAGFAGLTFAHNEPARDPGAEKRCSESASPQRAARALVRRWLLQGQPLSQSSFGTFTFDVAQRTIRAEHRWRWASIEEADGDF